jgi:branched-chain amino acid aminotransferase
MAQLVNIDGKIYPPEEAKIPVFDHGFLYGDNVYEAVRTHRGKLFLLDQHIERLQNSARMLHLPLPLSVEKIKAEIVRTVEAAANPETYVRLIITRGVGRIGLDIDLSSKPSYIMIVVPLEPPPPSYYKDGVKIALVDIRRNDRLSLNPGMKTGNLLNNVLGYMETKKENAYEGIFCNIAGYVTEGTVSNVFIVKNGQVITPPPDAGLLLGVTRGLTLELAAENKIPLEQRNFYPTEMLEADECFITSTTKAILPVREVSNRKFSPAPGPITKKLMDAYHQFAEGD